MGRYYKHAAITIAADVARGDHEGFLSRPRQLRAPSIFIPFKTQSTSTTTNMEGVYIHDSWKRHQFRACDNPLMERAWTLQEDLLSPRTVHYTSEQLVWECQCRKYGESDVNPMDNSIGHVWQNLKPHFLEPSSKSPYLSRYGESSTPMYRWYTIMNDFMRRSLKFDDDRLPAISSIAREIQQQVGYTYKAGLWMEDIARSLLWKVNGGGKSPGSFRAPTWSWASLGHDLDSGPLCEPDIFIHGLPFPENICLVKLRDSQIEAADGDAFGRVKAGSMSHQGKYILATKLKRRSAPYFSAYWKEQRSHLKPPTKVPHPVQSNTAPLSSISSTWKQKLPSASISLDIVNSSPDLSTPDQIIYHFDSHPIGTSMTQRDLKDITLLQISKLRGRNRSGDVFLALMLRPAGDEEGTYRRVGVAEIPSVTEAVPNEYEDDGSWFVREVGEWEEGQFLLL
jgi:hypothetical protein